MMSAITQVWPNRPGSPDPAMLLAAFEACSESLAIAASAVIVYANPACSAMFECAHPSRLQGRAVGDFFPSDSISVISAGTRSAEQQPVSRAHCVHTGRNGVGFDLEVNRAGFRLRGSEFQIIHARDVSQQTQTERQLRESQNLEAVGRLVGGVAHDFNNLLTGIMLYCDLLIGELAADSLPRHHAQDMRTAGEHGAALVQQLLALARPSRGEVRQFALNDVITDIQDLLIRLVGENVALSTSLAADLGAVSMDPAQLQQILLNLVLNARDAMPEGGRITLTTRNCTDDLSVARASEITSWVELTVSDSGSGMDAETLDRAFEPFFTTKQTGRGSGLGLATARRLARQAGGTMLAESAPGKGTRICLRLPRAQPDAAIKFENEVIS